MNEGEGDRSAKIDYSLAMSMINGGHDISELGLDDTERRVYQEMTGKLSIDQTELNSILNSAIA